IGLIDHDDPTKNFCDLKDLSVRNGITCRVIWRAQKDQSCLVIDRFTDLFKINIKFTCQRCPLYFDIINARGDRIHSVSRRTNDNIVDPGLAKYPKHQIDRLIAAVPDKYLRSLHTINLSYLFPYSALYRIGIPIVILSQRRTESILIGVKKYLCFAGEFSSS